MSLRLAVFLGLALAAGPGPASAETLSGLALAPGDRLTWRTGSGERFTEEVEAVADGVATIRSSRGGVIAQPLEFVLPPLRWRGEAGSDGSHEIVGVVGDLFPLAPDKRMTVTYRGRSGQEPEGWTEVRVCSVGAPAEAEVPAGRFTVLPVSCQEANRSRQWLFAPALGLVVRYENIHRLDGGATQELVAVERAVGP